MGAPKQKWTAEEEAALKAGIAKYGIGKWSTILKDSEFSFALRMRSNVDLKDKWRNLHVLGSGLGARQRSRPVAKKCVQPTPVLNDDSMALVPFVEGDFKISDAEPLAIINEALPNCGTKKPISRLDDHILEAIYTLKEPCGSNRRSIAMQIEEQYITPPNFERLLAENLKLMTENGKLIKVKHQYRIAPSSTSLDVKKYTSPLLLEGKKVLPKAEMNGNKIVTSSLLMDGKKHYPKGEVNVSKVPTLEMLIEKKDPPLAEKKGHNVLTKADIVAELKKMMTMTPQEAAAAAAQAVKEAEAALAEAEEATKEAENAESEAETARAFAEAAESALKCRKFRTWLTFDKNNLF